MESTLYTLESQVLFMRIELLLTVLVLAATVLPVLYNYIVVNVSKWYINVCNWYDFTFHPFLKFLICLGTVWSAFIIQTRVMTLAAIVIVFMMFCRMFNSLWDSTYGTSLTNIGKTYNNELLDGFKLYKIKNIEPIYNIFKYKECVSCDEEFVREKGWAVRVIFRNYNSKMVYVCKECAPTKQDVEDYLEDDQMMGVIYEQIKIRKKEAPAVWQGVNTDTYNPKY